MNTVPEEPQTFTTTSSHVKNPKRVAQGKRLAEISKAAKQKKKQEAVNDIPDPQDFTVISQGISLCTTLTVIGTTAALVSTYIAYKRWTQPQPNEVKHVTPKKNTSPKTRHQKHVTKNTSPKTILNNLDKFSL